MMFCAVSVFAQNTDEQGVVYLLYASPYTAEVSGHTKDLATEIVIPATFSSGGTEYKVTSIGEGVFNQCNLTSVTIQGNVTSIGNGAFANCQKLASVTIPNSVTTIGNYAFDHCVKLTTITIPNNVTSIGNGAFNWCTGMTDVYCNANPANLTWTGGSGDFQSGGATRFHVPSEYLEAWREFNVNVTFDDVFPLDNANTDYQGIKYTLTDGTSPTATVSGYTDGLATEIVIPATIKSNGTEYSVTSIGYGAFNGCTSLTSVTIPNSVTSIGEYAFLECTSLASVTIPNSVTSIGEEAFSNTALTTVTIPNSVTSIGENAFYGCQSITDVYCYANPDNLSWDDGYCDDFKSGRETKCHVLSGTLDKWNTKFQDVVYVTFVDDQVITLDGDNTDNQGIKYKLIDGSPRTAEVIGHTDDLNANIYIPKTIQSNGNTYTVTSIGESAFNQCSSLTSVTIPNSVTSIDYAAFSNTALTTVTIPNSVTNIGGDAFYGCQSITDVYCYANPDNLSWDDGYCDDFKSGRETKCHVLSGTLDKWNTKFQDVVYVTFVDDQVITLDGDNTDNQGIKYKLIDGSPRTAEVIGHTDDLNAIIYIPKTIQSNGNTYTVKSIGSSAFYNCSSLTSVTIPNSVTSIGTEAFWKCTNLTTVSIANSVMSIGSYAFSYCNKLTSVTIPNSLTNISSGTFTQCTSLASVTIPNSVTSIGNSAFTACNFTTVTIPNSVTSIGDNAFYGCTDLTDVYCYADPDNLTWNEGNCDDFKFKRGTKCHVLNLEKWNTKFKDVVNVTFVGELLDDNNTDFQGIKYTLDNDSHTAVVSGHTNALKSEITIPTAISSNGVTYSVTSIGNNAFKNYRELTSATIPNSVTSIGEDAFGDCMSLTSVTIPNSVTSIGKYAFQYTKLTSVTIPNSVTSIGNYAFKGCKCTSVTIPNSVTSIGVGMFMFCENLTSVTIPNSVTSIGKYAFEECTGLTSVTIERGDLGNLVLGKDVFYYVPSNCDIELKYTGTLHKGFSVAYDITANKGISINGNKMVFAYNTSEATLTTKEVSGALSITKSNDGKLIANIDGKSSSSISLDEDIAVSTVTYNRAFVNDGGAYTVMLPFDFTVTSDVKGSFYTLSSLETTETPSVWKAKMSDAITDIKAHTPYIFMPSEDFDEMTFSDAEGITLKATTSAPLTNPCANSNWKLHGVYDKKVWTDEDVNDYGFAATASGDIAVGEFVHFVAGASLKATRCYLEYSENGFSKSSPVLPERIIVVFPDETASVIEPSDPDDNGEIITPVSEIAPNLGTKVWSADKTIVIKSKAGDQYRIIDLNGRTLRESRLATDREEVSLSHAAGIVVVIVNGKTFKVNY